MTNFSTPFAYFVFLSWSFFIMALFVYLSIWFLCFGIKYFRQVEKI